MDKKRHNVKPYLFSEWMNVENFRCLEGRCEFEVALSENQLQRSGYAHGGVIAALIDHCAGSAAASIVEKNQRVLTSDLNVSYLRPGMPPRIRLEAKVIKKGTTLIVCEASVYNLNRHQETEKSNICAVGRVTLPIVKAAKD